MSFKFDPTNFHPVNPKINVNGGIPLQPKPHPVTHKSPLQWWADAMFAGTQMEKLPSEEYCNRAWVHQTGLPPDQATKEFMKACSEHVGFFKKACRFDRLNL